MGRKKGYLMLPLLMMGFLNFVLLVKRTGGITHVKLKILMTLFLLIQYMFNFRPKTSKVSNVDINKKIYA